MTELQRRALAGAVFVIVLGCVRFDPFLILPLGIAALIAEPGWQ